MMSPGTAKVLKQLALKHECAKFRRRWRRLLRSGTASMLLAAAPALAVGPATARPAAPLRIPLAPLGFQPIAVDFLLAGSSMLTVDFVDRDHLLVTFAVRRLMKRDPADPVDDDDRTIGAFLVELPSGRVLARTDWRLHDRSQYLWNLGHGRFMLRVRDQISMIAPMDPANSDDPFRPAPLLHIDRHIVAILVSPDCDLLTLETTKWAMGSGEASQGFSADPAPVQINFYRLSDSGPPPAKLLVSSAGTIRTKTAVALPMTTAGRLDVLDGGKDRWFFNFDEHAGKVDELAAFDSSCFPRPIFVGHGEFIAFGCRGGTDKIDLAGFNLKGEEMWQQNFYDTHVSPTFSFAPEAGRFAMGRTIVSGDFDAEMPLPASVVTGQEVRVYQSYDGKLLFKTDLTPVERAGQNFALSSDGTRLAVVRETLVRHPSTRDDPAYTQTEAGIEVYPLAPLTPEDQAAVADARKSAPADTGERIDMALLRTAGDSAGKDSADGGGEKILVGGEVALSTAVPSAADTEAEQAQQQGATNAGPDADAVQEGDVQPTGPRQRPTLYSPDEKPQSNQP